MRPRRSWRHSSRRILSRAGLATWRPRETPSRSVNHPRRNPVHLASPVHAARSGAAKPFAPVRQSPARPAQAAAPAFPPSRTCPGMRARPSPCDSASSSAALVPISSRRRPPLCHWCGVRALELPLDLKSLKCRPSQRRQFIKEPALVRDPRCRCQVNRPNSHYSPLDVAALLKAFVGDALSSGVSTRRQRWGRVHDVPSKYPRLLNTFLRMLGLDDFDENAETPLKRQASAVPQATNVAEVLLGRSSHFRS